jgi:hypothetical protein
MPTTRLIPADGCPTPESSSQRGGDGGGFTLVDDRPALRPYVSMKSLVDPMCSQIDLHRPQASLNLNDNRFVFVPSCPS